MKASTTFKKKKYASSEVFYSFLFYIFKEYASSDAMRKQEQVLVLLTREMRKAEARPHDSWHRTY